MTNERMIEYNGQIKSMRGWARFYGLPYSTVATRLKRGWSIEDALTTPGGRPHDKLEAKGITRTRRNWEKVVGLSKSGLCYRIRAGWKPDDVVKPPKRKGITAWGRTQTYRQWEAEMNISHGAFAYRLNTLKMTPEQALSMPVNRKESK